jgi:hypothetical protein
MIVEIAEFKTKKGVTDLQVLKASQKAYDDFLSKCKGFISRELIKSDDETWMDVVHFETVEDAENAAREFPNNPGGKAFEEVIDMTTAKMLHFKVAKKY